MLHSKDLVKSIEKSTGIQIEDPEGLLDLCPRHHQGWDTARVGYNKLLEEFGDKLPHIESGIILDAGCARGRVSKELANYYKGCKIIGIDIEEHRLNPNPSDLPIEFRKGNFYRLDLLFPHEYFAAIFVMCNLTHVAAEISLLEHILIAENFHRALKKGGYLCISGGGSDSGVVLNKQGNDFKQQYVADAFKNCREFSNFFCAYEIK